MCREPWWNDIGRKKRKYLSQCYCVYHKSHMGCAWIDPGVCGRKLGTS